MNHDISAIASLFSPRNHHYWRKNCKRIGDVDNCKYAKDPITYECIETSNIIPIPTHSVDGTYWCFSRDSLVQYLTHTNVHPFTRSVIPTIYRYISSNDDVQWLITWCYVLRKIQTICAKVTEDYGGYIGFLILNTVISGQTDTSGNIVELYIHGDTYRTIDGILSLLKIYDTPTLEINALDVLTRLKNTLPPTEISSHEEVRASMTNSIPFVYI